LTPAADIAFIDLQALWFDVSDTGDGISITYAVR
jgi:hypothetical protein